MGTVVKPQQPPHLKVVGVPVYRETTTFDDSKDLCGVHNEI